MPNGYLVEGGGGGGGISVIISAWDLSSCSEYSKNKIIKMKVFIFIFYFYIT